MKRKSPKKLAINTETLKVLGREELSQVEGGTYTYPTNRRSCVSVCGTSDPDPYCA
jgi:hypothetical protein